MIQNAYINQLWNALENTEFYDVRKVRFKDYDSGIHALLSIFLHVKYKKGKVFFIGNGGSAAIANHMTADYMKNGNMTTCSLYNSAVLTCLSNDYAYEYVFSKQIELQASEGDLLVAISSSGNSSNIINAIQAAKNKNVNVITFTGFQKDNQAKQIGDFNVYVPESQYGIVESVHNLILQQIVDYIFERNRKELQ